MRFCWSLVRCRPSKALALGGRRWDLRWTVCAGGEGGLDHVDIWEIVLVIKLLEQLLNLRFTFQMSGLRVLLWVLWKQGSEARFSCQPDRSELLSRCAVMLRSFWNQSRSRHYDCLCFCLRDRIYQDSIKIHHDYTRIWNEGHWRCEIYEHKFSM